MKLIYEKFPDIDIHDKRVCDFGCGIGKQCLEITKKAKYTVGIDCNKKNLKKARSICIEVDFFEKPPNHLLGTFDIVISRNSFEHFYNPSETLKEMFELLSPSGKLYITFGPLWYSPWGTHMKFFLPLPWVQFFLPEMLVLWIRSFFRSDSASTYEEAGLNKMTVSKFKKVTSGYAIVFLSYECIFNLNFLSKIPFLNELFINRINCIISGSSG